MDQTIRTIRQETRKAGEGILPDIVLVVDTNILADLGWKRDAYVKNLVSMSLENPKLLIITPRICSIEFLAVTFAEVGSLTEVVRQLKAKLPDIKRYGDAKLTGRIHEVIDDVTKLADRLRESPRDVLKNMSKLILVFKKNLTVQFEEAYYAAKNPKYELEFEDALVFSFVKLFGIALDECTCVFG